MILVLFPPGCYGTFVSKCLYYLTDLQGSNLEGLYLDKFEFDEEGSSHDFRKILNNTESLMIGHPHLTQLSNIAQEKNLTTGEIEKKSVIVLPCRNHYLDYLDNQFLKNINAEIISSFNNKIFKFIGSMYSTDEIKTKLSQCYNFTDNDYDNVPRWIVREWCSFWIQHALATSYSLEPLKKFPLASYISTKNLFENLFQSMSILAERLGLRMVADITVVDQIQKKFTQHQKFHGIQIKCEEWVNHVINNQAAESPCMTVFDEAFVQSVLREKNWEIRCTGLDQFPSSSQELHELIYYVPS